MRIGGKARFPFFLFGGGPGGRGAGREGGKGWREKREKEGKKQSADEEGKGKGKKESGRGLRRGGETKGNEKKNAPAVTPEVLGGLLHGREKFLRRVGVPGRPGAAGKEKSAGKR